MCDELDIVWNTTSSICGIFACTVMISLEAIGFKLEHKASAFLVNSVR